MFNQFLVSFSLDDCGPLLKVLAPSPNGSAVLVSWSWPGNKPWSPPGGEVLHYVLECRSVPVAELQWQQVAEDQNSTSFTGTEHFVVRHRCMLFNHNVTETFRHQHTMVSTVKEAVTSCGHLVNHTSV